MSLSLRAAGVFLLVGLIEALWFILDLELSSSVGKKFDLRLMKVGKCFLTQERGLHLELELAELVIDHVVDAEFDVRWLVNVFTLLLTENAGRSWPPWGGQPLGRPVALPPFCRRAVAIVHVLLHLKSTTSEGLALLLVTGVAHEVVEKGRRRGLYLVWNAPVAPGPRCRVDVVTLRHISL